MAAKRAEPAIKGARVWRRSESAAMTSVVMKANA